MSKRHIICEIELEGAKAVSVKVSRLKIESLRDASGSKYLNENLETAIAQLVIQMIDDEIKASGCVGKKREEILKRIGNQKAKQTRKRVVDSENLITPLEIKEMRGRRLISFPDRDKFLMEFLTACREIRGKKTFSKTNIAKRMFVRETNPLKKLRENLEKFRLNFDEIVSATEGEHFSSAK